MSFVPQPLLLASLCLLGCLGAHSVYAQETEDPLSTELELGAIFTSGNTEDENIKFKANVMYLRESWEYGFSIDGFRSSKNNVLAAQRLYTVASATYNLNQDSFIQSRVAHEDDRFSGYDSQSDVSVSYGQNLLREHESLDWNYTIGAGMRYSREPNDTTSEAILRLASELRWNVSENALFIQTLSAESGSKSTIGRSESSIQSDIMDNLSMKFSIKIKHQTEVPIGRKKTDSEASVTLLWRL
tara:strand:- start:439 stop:1167 length:729 start_codon:yes stop_codon:yes gene_type:complete